MKRILISAGLFYAMFLAVCGPALAQEGGGSHEMAPQLYHWAITALGMVAAARWALLAFGRAVPIADVPTFPIYMASRQQYRLGGWAFVAFACGFFLLLVHEHRSVVLLAKPLNIIPESIIAAISDQSTPYLVIVAAMGAVYVYCLTYEKPWNVLLMMRDVIQSWISVPQLAKQIVAQIQFSLRVPQSALSEVIASSNGVVTKQDFCKDINTPDRKWAETCYMKWWLTQGLDSGDDAIFFTEESFAFDKLVADFGQAAWSMGNWKSGAATNLAASDVTKTVNELHNRFSRLVACYLIYRHGSRKELGAEAFKFGIRLPDKVTENPLRYWIVYMIALMGSVYVGVHASAIGFDLATGAGLNLAQDSNLAMKWVMYSVTNYGLAIIVVLLLRVLATSLAAEATQWHLVTYCWTFVAAFLVGPAGLTCSAYFLAPADFIGNQTFVMLYGDILKWGLGPALVCVYISYYLDRQTYADLPDIVHSTRTIGWRLLNCFGFASLTLFLLLPPLLALPASSEAAAWSTDKLRFVASGATFFVALGLALAAQFALRKSGEARNAVASPQAVA
jgi:hypothetical protein